MLKSLKKIGKQSFTYALTKAVAAVFAILIVPILAKNFSPSDYGTIDLILTINSFLMIFLMLGLDSAVSRFYFESPKPSIKKKYISNAFLFLIIEIILVSSTLVMLAPRLSQLIFSDSTKILILEINFIAVPFTVCFSFLLSILVNKFKPWHYAGITILQLILSLIFNVIFVIYLKFGIKGAILANLMSYALAFFVVFFSVRKDLVLSLEKKFLQSLLAFGPPILPAGIALWILDLSDRFFVIKYVNSEQLGIYAMAVKISFAVSLIVAAFAIPWNPFAFSIKHKSNARKIYAKFFTYYFAASSFMAILATYLSKPLILLLANSQYLDAVKVVGPLTLSVTAYGCFLMLALGINMVKKTWYISMAFLAAAALNISLNFYVVPRYGILGAALTTLFAYVLGSILVYKISQKLYFIPYQLGKLFIIGFFTIILIGVQYWVSRHGYSPILSTVAALIIFMAIVWFLVASSLEKNILIKTLKGKNVQ